MLLAKQSEEIKKIANDIKNGQALIMDQIKKIDNSIIADLSGKVYDVEDCCNKQRNQININQQFLIDLKNILANFTIRTPGTADLTSLNSSSEGRSLQPADNRRVSSFLSFNDNSFPI